MQSAVVGLCTTRLSLSGHPDIMSAAKSVQVIRVMFLNKAFMPSDRSRLVPVRTELFAEEKFESVEPSQTETKIGASAESLLTHLES